MLSYLLTCSVLDEGYSRKASWALTSTTFLFDVYVINFTICAPYQTDWKTKLISNIEQHKNILPQLFSNQYQRRKLTETISTTVLSDIVLIIIETNKKSFSQSLRGSVRCSVGLRERSYSYLFKCVYIILNSTRMCNHYIDWNYVFMYIFWGKTLATIGCGQSYLNK